ncbi:MAG: 2-succinyl-5-enolpyruvyl-6-hydroxy-3-cyclohexene-1-carboxylic-acid synthase, partial [Candidatus Zixiibacteriota bacterium]
PHGLSFQKSAEQFGIDYFHLKTTNDFIKNYLASQKKSRSSIIEITTNRKANWELHQKISKAVNSALDKD